MLFESLDKIKRNSIMSAILLTALGSVILICPEEYINSLILVFGYSLIVMGIVMILSFFSSNKSLMEYLKFVGALILGIIGICTLLYKNDIMKVLAWLFGFFLMLDGARTLFHSFIYARRSKRKGWWILAILSFLLIATGIVIFANPWWDTPNKLMKVIGGTILFSSLVSAVRLIWTWPLRNLKGGNNNG